MNAGATPEAATPPDDQAPAGPPASLAPPAPGRTGAAAEAPTARRGGPSLSLRRRVRVVFAAAITVAVLAAVVGGLAISSVLDARGRVVDDADPALFQAERLQAALLDQETGLRAYIITGDDSFLGPYRNGEAVAGAAAGRLTELLSDAGSTDAPLADVLAAVDRWRRSYAEPTIAAVGAGDASAATPGALRDGRLRFDEIRATVTALEAELDRLRTDARSDLRGATTRLIVVLAGGLGLLLLAVGALWRLVRQAVERPLDRLRADAALVAGGDLEHHIEPVGPTELRELGAAMEAMRARIAADLHEVRDARAELEQRTDELARSNTELEQFAYVASHDLQEPLRKVASFCQLLQNRYGGQLDERADQYIGFAVDGAKRMQALINDLLGFSRVGRITRPFERVSLDGALDVALGNLAEALDESGALVERDPLPEVLGEAGLLSAVLQNLVGNAVKFRRPDTNPRVEVRCRRIEAGEVAGASDWRAPAPMHQLTVHDDGIGIEAEYAERVFIIFQRLHAKEAYAGTGIGLALCRKIVEYHGGRIWVDTSDPAAGTAAAGTTIHLTLPIAEEPS